MRSRLVLVGSPGEADELGRLLGERYDVVLAPTVDDAARPPGDGSAHPFEAPAIDSQQILQKIAFGISVVTPDRKIIWNNQAFATLCAGAVRAGDDVYAALVGPDGRPPAACPFDACNRGTLVAQTRLRQKTGRHLELTVQPIADSKPDNTSYLVLLRDTTAEVSAHEKLLAIQRAGLELSYLTQAELAEMSTGERIDLLKANIMQYSHSILDYKSLEIRLLEPKTGLLRVLLSEGMTAFAEHRELYARTEDNGVTGYVAATGVSYLCNDVEHDPHYLRGAPDARSSITVPIIYRDRVSGTFNVESPKPDRFGDSDREFLEVFARQIAVALNTLELLQAEKQISGSASVEAILTEVGLPVDEIVTESIRLLAQLSASNIDADRSRESLRHVLQNARAIKSSIQKVGRSFAGRADESAAKIEPSLLAGRTVLFVDADQAIRKEAHRLLSRVGCNVDTARDGNEALALVRDFKYDVIFTDIRLPDLNGYEIFSRLRQEAPATPVVLMTGFGYDAQHCMVKARQEGQRVVLYKPFRLDRLSEAIEDAIDPEVARRRVPKPTRL